ncbi:MAG: hypothetical protein PVI23_01390 [Maricaulaceae bacterium]
MLVRAKLQTVLGHAIASPRITPTAVWLLFSRIGVPILALGALADLAMQLLFGVCTGLWCVV